MIDKIKCFHDEMFIPADDEFADHPDPKYRFPSMISEMKNVVSENMLKIMVQGLIHLYKLV